MTQNTQNSTVVVGVDGSEDSHRALQWAAREARQRGTTLHIVHAFPTDPPVAAGREPDARAGAQEVVDAAANRARERTNETVAVEATIVDGPPAKALVDESQRHALLVVGNRGQGGFAELLLGSVPVHVTAYAACPVVVVPRHNQTSPAAAAGPLVVGVDASEGSTRAIEFAFARAHERGAGLVALHAWQLPTAYSAAAAAELLKTDSDQAEHAARTRLASAVAPWQDRHPKVTVDQRTVHGHTVGALVEASAQGAQAVVVGARGHGTLVGLALGSVSQGLLHHARSPVIVVR